MPIRRLPQRRGNILLYLILLAVTLAVMMWLRSSRPEEIKPLEESTATEADGVVYIDAIGS